MAKHPSPVTPVTAGSNPDRGRSVRRSGISFDVVSDTPPDTSHSAHKGLGHGGGGMADNPGIKGISETPFKRPHVTRADVLTNHVTARVKSGLPVRNMLSTSEVKRTAGHAPGGHRATDKKEPVK